MGRKKIKNPLIKRIQNEIIGDWKKYLVVFIFLLLTIGFVSGMYVANDSMLTSADEGVSKYKQEDGPLSTNGKIVIEEIFHMLKRTHHSIVCEGVETKEVADFLTVAGCGKASGRNFIGQLSAFCLIKAAVHIGIYDTAGYGIYRNMRWRKLLAECLGKCIYTALAG